jgi:hypothetical protein
MSTPGGQEEEEAVHALVQQRFRQHLVVQIILSKLVRCAPPRTRVARGQRV